MEEIPLKKGFIYGIISNSDWDTTISLSPDNYRLDFRKIPVYFVERCM